MSTSQWERLGLPGLFDVHVHFLPEAIQRKVWAQFDEAGPKIGRDWPIFYRGSDQERVEQLRSFGVRRFSSLPYAHRPGVAGWLNDWSRDFAVEVPECLWSATFYPEPDVAGYVTDLVEAGVELFKVHVQVGEFLLDDPHLDGVWPVLVASGVPALIHAGSGPVGNEFTGPASLARVLGEHPGLTVIVAHMGSPEHADFLDLAERHERVFLDTSMAFTEFFGRGTGFPEELLPRLADLEDRVLWGSDFPTLPFPYDAQLEDVAASGLGDDWLRKVLWRNAVDLFGEPPV